ncbi:MAG TPA: hypothetical protein PLL44_11095 [Novosphingobium sp.]|jgi:hypothetical protein|nr:hypothetical protein [Novosphingobium sp.]HQQ07362.1 hypothetical protein [Novosphingobium sp.]
MTDGIASGYDRFAAWPKTAARAALLALVALLVASAIVPIRAAEQKIATVTLAQQIRGETGTPRPRDDDLALYDRVIERIGKGENYYTVAAEEHRRSHYPLRPGVAVRLPTLAYLLAWLGDGGQVAASALLVLAVLAAWWRRLGEEPGGADRRMIAMALLALGASLGFNRYFFTLHELWSGMLLALAFGLHRPGRKWGAALAVAALALAIREHALPFVLLMAAMALWRRDWTEGAAWSALALAFVVGLAVHLHLVAQLVLPSDPEGPDWLVLRGLSGWLSSVVLSSNLRLLPHFVAGPLVVLMVLGWAGWKSAAGEFAALLQLGYGLAFMLAGRPDNYYWGAMVAPTLAMGLAWAPMALKGLVRAAR